MRYKGKIVSWNNDKAFGFIRLLQSSDGKDIFVHKTDINGLTRTPVEGDIITFSLGKDHRGRSKAVNATILAAQKKHKQNTIKEYNIFVGMAFFLFLGACYFSGKIDIELIIGYTVMSGIAFVLYLIDKRASKEKGIMRTPEKTLLLVGLLGGWPGAIFAQQFLRHKSSKVSFRRLFWITVVVNILCFVVYLYYK